MFHLLKNNVILYVYVFKGNSNTSQKTGGKNKKQNPLPGPNRGHAKLEAPLVGVFLLLHRSRKLSSAKVCIQRVIDKCVLVERNDNKQ